MAEIESGRFSDSLEEPGSYGEPLGWRDLIVGSNVHGVVKLLAMQAEVLSLTENSVKLRLAGSVFANDENRRMLEEKISAYLGFPFRVEWEFGDVAVGATLDDYEKKKKEDARARNMEVFSKDPIVAEIVKQFGGQVDELSLVGMK